jgi:transposase-like protein
MGILGFYIVVGALSFLVSLLSPFCRPRWVSLIRRVQKSVVKQMMAPNPTPVSQLVKETGVSDVTLYKWRKDYRNRGLAVPADSSKSENWSAEDKLAVVIESAALNEARLSEYCRGIGLYIERV